MKTLKILGIIILIIVAAFLIIPLFLSDNVFISSEKVIQAEPSVIFQQVNNLKSWKNWSPFESDTTMVDTYEGPEAGVGAIRSWKGEKSGNGTLTIIESEPYSLIRTKLEFSPDMGGASGTWEFKEGEEGTHVLWTLHITGLKYPFERWYGLMSNAVMKPLMEQGLTSLKKVAEAKPAVHIEVVELPAQPSLSIVDSTTIDGIGAMLERNYGAVMAYLQEKQIPITGFPFAVYYNWDPEGIIVIRAGVPVAEKAKGHERIEYYELPAGQAIHATHKGGYDSGETHYAIDNYIKAKNIQNVESYIWEVYVTDPATEPDTAKWVTEIYYPLK